MTLLILIILLKFKFWQNYDGPAFRDDKNDYECDYVYGLKLLCMLIYYDNDDDNDNGMSVDIPDRYDDV